jgi:DNA-binding NtrC family response regulator
MQVRSIAGSEVLLVEDEPLIAIDVAHALEREGAVVHFARDLESALRMADYPSLSAGIIDLRLAAGSAEIVCEKLAQRSIPFIFYTGALPEQRMRFPGAPRIPKPAAAPIIIGALRYALSAEPHDIVAPLDADRNPMSAIRDGEKRMERVQALIARLEAMGSDTSVAQRLLASICTAVETMRYSANICAAPPWSGEGRFNRRRP